VLLRFCPEPYHPFDPTITDKFVVHNSKKTIHDMPSLKTFISDFKMSSKSSLETHLRSEGFNTLELWQQVDDIAVNLLLEKEESIVKEGKEFGNLENFFELVRFEFIVDEAFEVHLLEIEKSPQSIEKFAESHEQVVYNALHCAVGIDHKIE
jgi:tubulin monoglycylase TTLL15